jgi:hypothetical protein
MKRDRRQASLQIAELPGVDLGWRIETDDGLVLVVVDPRASPAEVAVMLARWQPDR